MIIFFAELFTLNLLWAEWWIWLKTAHPGAQCKCSASSRQKSSLFFSFQNMSLGVQRSVKTHMQNQSYLPSVLAWPYCPLLLPTLLYNTLIWNQELRPYWEGIFNWFTLATLHMVLYEEFSLSYLRTHIMVTVGGKKRIIVYPPWKL